MPYVLWGDRDAIAEFKDEAEALRLARAAWLDQQRSFITRRISKRPSLAAA